ncbi:MAG: phosphoglycerate kinase [Proteobacteria bacterium]|nr:phosphoglycerate kinase [Pseudomonadota bacterium]
MFSFKTIDDINTQQESIFVRADLNVPLKDGKIVDSTRIVKFIPTLQNLLLKTKVIVIATHLGRPDPLNDVPKDHPLSTKILVPEIEKYLNKSIKYIDACIHYDDKIKEPGIYLLENLRFYEGEEKNDNDFAKQILGKSKIYVNDAFSCSHRAHASISAITNFAQSFAGLLMENELKHLMPILESTLKPTIAIVGGSKISTKMSLLQNLLQKVDYLFVAGAMANTFLKAKGVDIGQSLFEEGYIDYCLNLLKKYEDKILLPKDYWVASSLHDQNPHYKTTQNPILKDMILDFGAESIQELKHVLEKCQCILWNGPLGAYEYSPYEKGSLIVSKIVSELTKNKKITSIAGGGDTIAVLQKANVLDDFSFVSTAGGAFLEMLEGKILPGIEALSI